MQTYKSSLRRSSEVKGLSHTSNQIRIMSKIWTKLNYREWYPAIQIDNVFLNLYTLERQSITSSSLDNLLKNQRLDVVAAKLNHGRKRDGSFRDGYFHGRKEEGTGTIGAWSVTAQRIAAHAKIFLHRFNFAIARLNVS